MLKSFLEMKQSSQNSSQFGWLWLGVDIAALVITVCHGSRKETLKQGEVA